jgi:Protein of unknown function (DUF1326)
MKVTNAFFSILLVVAAGSASAVQPRSTALSGDYLEVRSCDVYTGPCFANGEMGLAGKEGMLVWSVREGDWQGVSLAGLNVIAVVKTHETLGDMRYHPRSGKAVLIVDAKASSEQRRALQAFARSMAGPLIREVADVQVAPIVAEVGTCQKSGCAKVEAGDLVDISTRCLCDEDHLCGNEEIFYPPLTDVTGARPAFAERASFLGARLNSTWQLVGLRSAFIGGFTLHPSPVGGFHSAQAD